MSDLSPEMRTRVAELYASGMDTYDIAKKLKLPEAKVYGFAFARRQTEDFQRHWPQREDGKPLIKAVGV